MSVRLLSWVLVVSLGLTVVALPSVVGARPDAAPVTSLPLQGVTVNLDPGHNPGNARHTAQINRLVHRGPIRKACDTTGTATNAGYAEARFTMELARRVQRMLEARGATVTLTRTERTPVWGPCVTRRADLGSRADVSVSLHADGNLGRGARGFHVIRPGRVRGYTDRIVEPSHALASQLRDALVAAGLRPSTYLGRAGIDVRTDLGGLTLSSVPKVMLEAGNMRDAGDARLLRSSSGQQRIASAVVAALVRWHRVDLR